MTNPNAETAPISNRDRGMFFGFSLESWENAMVTFLVIAGVFALLAGLATWAVVRLQRVEIAGANARQAEAELKLGELRKLAGPREIKFDAFKKALEGKPKRRLRSGIYQMLQMDTGLPLAYMSRLVSRVGK